MAAAAESTGQEGRFTMCAFLSTLGVAVAPLIFGMSLGFTSPAIDTMQNTVHAGSDWVPAPADLTVFSTEQGSAEGPAFGSFLNVGALIGSLLGGPISHRAGRKAAIALQALIFGVSWLLGLLSSFPVLLLMRTLQGVGVGLVTSTVPVYINETAPKKMAGAFGAMFQMAVVLGIMLTNLLGAFVFVVEEGGHQFCQWRYMALAGIAPSLLLFILTVLVPESPRWLAKKGRFHDAQASLAKLRGTSDLGDELQELQKLAALSPKSRLRKSHSSKVLGGSDGLKDMWTHRKSLGIGLMLMFIQQFSGINAVIFFQGSIFQEAGMDNPAALGFWVMVCQVLMTALAIPLMNSAGRKVLLLISTIGMAACCLGMVVFFGHAGPGWLALLCSFAYIAFFSVGLGPVPWLMMAEIFPDEIRSSAASLVAACNWLFSFVTTQTLSPFKDALGFIGVFSIYGVVLMFGAAYVLFVVTETKAVEAKSVAKTPSRSQSKTSKSGGDDVAEGPLSDGVAKDPEAGSCHEAQIQQPTTLKASILASSSQQCSLEQTKVSL